MENFKEKRLEREVKAQKTTSIVIAVILLLSIVGNVFLVVRNSTINNEKEELVKEKNLVEEDKILAEESNAQLKAEIEILNEQLEELEEAAADLKVEIHARDARISRLRRETFEMDDLRRQIAELEKIEQEYEKIEDEKNNLLAELEELNNQLLRQEEENKNLNERIMEATYLRAYNICVNNFRDRWICRPVYMDVAGRVDRTSISFEINDNLFVEQGEKNIHMVMTGPDGSIIEPSTGTFTIEDTGETSEYTEHEQIKYDNESVTLSFDIEHTVSLEPGSYMIQVYIDGKESGAKEFSLE